MSTTPSATTNPPSYMFDNVYDFGRDGFLDSIEVGYDAENQEWKVEISPMIPMAGDSTDGNGGRRDIYMRTPEEFGLSSTTAQEVHADDLSLYGVILTGDIDGDGITDQIHIHRNYEGQNGEAEAPWQLNIRSSYDGDMVLHKGKDDTPFIQFPQEHPADDPNYIPQSKIKRM